MTVRTSVLYNFSIKKHFKA